MIKVRASPTEAHSCSERSRRTSCGGVGGGGGTCGTLEEE